MRDVAKHNPELLGVLDIKDYNERQSGQRKLDDDRLAVLIEVVSRHRLGLKNAEPDILGRAYEYLLRKFAEGQGQSNRADEARAEVDHASIDFWHVGVGGEHHRVPGLC
jgi:type I restriction-modification system DNA methylase subunit